MLVFAAAVATLGLAFALPVATPVRLVVLLWVALVALRALRRLREVEAVRVEPEGAVEVRVRGTWAAGRIRDGCVAFPWLTVVRWRPLGARLDQAVFLLPSMVDPAPFRALRLLLRWQKP